MLTKTTERDILRDALKKLEMTKRDILRDVLKKLESKIKNRYRVMEMLFKLLNFNWTR